MIHIADSISSILELGDAAKSVSIFVMKQSKLRKKMPSIFSIVQEILSRKCEKLYIKEFERTASISQSDAENLLQVTKTETVMLQLIFLKFFHHLNKPVSLTTFIDANPFANKIGAYEMIIIDNVVDKLVIIEHTEMFNNVRLWF